MVLSHFYRYLPSDGYYYTVSGGNTIPLMRSKDLLVWERAAGDAAPFIQASVGDNQTATSVMASAAANLVKGHANLSFPFRPEWDRDANDADMYVGAPHGGCCTRGLLHVGGAPRGLLHVGRPHETCTESIYV